MQGIPVRRPSTWKSFRCWALTCNQSECFTEGLKKAWDRRGRFKELRSRDSEGPIIIELQYRERPKTPLITYHLEIDEISRGPVVKHEFLRWKRTHPGVPFYFLDYRLGEGKVITGEQPEAEDKRIEKPPLAGERRTFFLSHPRPLRFGWHPKNAGLPDPALRSRSAPVDRYRGAGELSASQTSAGTGGRECDLASERTQLIVPPIHPSLSIDFSPPTKDTH